MGNRKNRTTSQKPSAASNRSTCTGTVTRAASKEQPATASRDTATNQARRASRKRSNDSANHPPAAKRPRHQGLTRNDIPKIVKLVLNAIDDNDTDCDADDGIEIPTMEQAEEESVAQELRMEQYRYAVYTMHTAHSHTTCTLMHVLPFLDF